MSEEHVFETTLAWPADPGQTRPPDAAYSRDNVLAAPGHAPIAGSSPPVFGGEASRYNPEELLTLSLSECHMLTYLALAAKKRIAVLAYEDLASGTLGRGPSGKMQMVGVVLRPRVTVAKGTDLAEARAMHEKAHAFCFVANSVNFPVRNEPETVEQAG
jgi:organic hydroperoxide reductase OsmC/OhrA